MNEPSGPAASIVQAWVSLYTRGLAPDVAARRQAEVVSDVWEQLDDAADPTAPSAGLSLLSRLVRGLPADLSWRHAERRAWKAGRPARHVLGATTMTVFRYVWVSAAVLLAMLEIFLLGVRNAVVPAWTGSPLAADVLLPVAFGVMVLTGLWMRRRNRMVGSVLVAVGALPAAALWWTVVLPTLVIIVLAGLIVDRRPVTSAKLA